MSYDAERIALSGYAALMDVDKNLFSVPGTHIVETIKRDNPEWANWILPIWFLKFGATTICSVSPAHRGAAEMLVARLAQNSLLSPSLTKDIAMPIVGGEWSQREILVYPSGSPPSHNSGFEVVRMQDRHGPLADRLLNTFDGGVFAIFADDEVASHAGIKNKGPIQEIAVGTESAFQRRGFGKVVVAVAVRHILAQGKAAVYIPDTLNNIASYALARSLGFVKLAETLDWAFERDE